MATTIPRAGGSVREAVAAFDDPARLEAVVSELQSRGFDRAEISLLAGEVAEGHGSRDYSDTRHAADDPAAGRGPMVSDTDRRQSRALGTGIAATIAAFAAAGFTVMTGGATALAVGVAAAAAGGVGTAGTLLGSGRVVEDSLKEQLDRGGVILWVRTRDSAAEQRACDILRRHGGRDVHLHDLPASS